MRSQVSQETLNKIKNGESKQIISFLPNDRGDCDCFGIINDTAEKLNNINPQDMASFKEKIGIIDCPASVGKKKFEIKCAKCGDLIAYIHASDKSLKDWCNLHYVSEPLLGLKTEIFHEYKKVKGKMVLKPIKKKVEVGEWHGCMGVQISPFDGALGLECACGNDTRDFRVKNNLTGLQLEAKLKYNMIGREFNQKDSKFILKEVSNGI